MSFSSFSAQIDSGSGNPVDNWRTLLTKISLNNVLSYIYWLFTTTIFPHRHSQGAEEGSSRDVESGGVMQLQTAAAAEPNNAFVVPFPIVVGGGTTQDGETLMGNQTVLIQGTRDVESGGGEALQLQAAAAEPSNAFVVPLPPIVGGGGGASTQVAETIMGNQTVVFEVKSGRGPASYVSEEEHVILLNPQFIGQQVVGIWIVPTVVGVISCLFQVVVGS